jgi:NAD(P)-dependent dehydrogenase (short-subunit alcohol dehydrogenase family)
LRFATYPSLVDRVVFISGGGSGIGADMVRAFHGQGAHVAFVDVQQQESEELVEELGTTGRPPLFQPCDVTRHEELQSCIARVRDVLGPVGVLVNNAANDQRHTIDEVTPEFWARTIDVNLTHHFFAAQAVYPQMRDLGGGAIINLSSTAWRFGAGEIPVYGAAKAGVVGLTNALARAFGRYRIRVNAIEPGAVMTKRQRRLWYTTQESVDAMAQRQILNEVLLGDEVARMALFLAADDSRMITKQSFTVDAGIR